MSNNRIQRQYIRGSVTLEKLRKERLEAIDAGIDNKNQLSIELTLLDEEQFLRLKYYQKFLNLPPLEIQDFLASPPNPEMATILNTGKDSDRLSKLTNWQNRAKHKKNTSTVKNLWQLGVPTLGYAIGLEAGYIFTQGNKQQAGMVAVTGLALVLFNKMTERYGREALADLPSSSENLPSVKFFLKGNQLSPQQVERLKQNLAALKPAEANLLSTLPWEAQRDFLSGSYQEQENIITNHTFSSSEWLQTIKTIAMKHATPQQMLEINGQTIINNLLVRRAERKELEAHKVAPRKSVSL